MKIRVPASIIAGALALVSCCGRAQAFIVYDPTNYAQNVLQAARALEQINNQIRQIENQATSLVNEAKNLASLPETRLASLEQQLDRTRQLLLEAQRISYSVASIDSAFTQRYTGSALTGSASQMATNAQARWSDSVAAFQDSLKVGATLVGNLSDTRETVTGLVGASQSASGALQAAQVGNQLLALQSQQLADLAAAMAAQARAQALEAANASATQAEGAARFKRFRGE
ncbi:P-type conjugative transfer protein TrbJ [Novosphingobium sp. 9]|uniref:P-type conjugative transfer protein TrbJ n=1 Tax=Novosphingobium sp. 9 TaxID=2025349 RepID=UPI0021B64D6F|nr:P-type conjugative transfer protein TrbJ [Novosphingobium sp. 9]